MTARQKYQNRIAQARRIIFEADTPAGKTFDVLLIICIILSVFIVMLDSVRPLHDRYGSLFYALEWFFTLLFTIEYVLRLITATRSMDYARSFFGIVDLLAIVPTYISIILPGSQFFLVIRILRVLRIFRVLKLVKFLQEARLLGTAVRKSSRKIAVFLFTVMTLVTIFGSLLYVIEGEQSGFTSIPRSIYWAIVTLTTVGYGDIHPKTNLGQTFAAIIMILGYAIIAVPTGIVTVEISKQDSLMKRGKHCKACKTSGHDHNARYCKYCGEPL